MRWTCNLPRDDLPPEAEAQRSPSSRGYCAPPNSKSPAAAPLTGESVIPQDHQIRLCHREPTPPKQIHGKANASGAITLLQPRGHCDFVFLKFFFFFGGGGVRWGGLYKASSPKLLKLQALQNLNLPLWEPPISGCLLARQETALPLLGGGHSSCLPRGGARRLNVRWGCAERLCKA